MRGESFLQNTFFSRVKFELNPVTNSPVADPLNPGPDPPLVSASSTRPIKTWLIWTETAETEMELWNHQLHRCHTFPEKFLSGEVPLVITSQLPSYTDYLTPSTAQKQSVDILMEACCFEFEFHRFVFSFGQDHYSQFLKQC